MLFICLHLCCHCRWYTSMVGKLPTLSVLVDRIRVLGIDNYALTELVQGQTRRWVVAWSFGDVRLPDVRTSSPSPSPSRSEPVLTGLSVMQSIARSLPSPHRSLFPYPSELRHTLNDDFVTVTPHTLLTTICNVLDVLDGVSMSTNDKSRENVYHDLRMSLISLRITATHNSWSRAARRAKAKGGLTPDNTSASSSDDLRAGLILDVTAHPGAYDKDGCGNPSYRWVLAGRWRRGRDRILFESLWGHLSRQIAKSLEFIGFESEPRTSVKRELGTAQQDAEEQEQVVEKKVGKRARKEGMDQNGRVLNGDEVMDVDGS